MPDLVGLQRGLVIRPDSAVCMPRSIVVLEVTSGDACRTQATRCECFANRKLTHRARIIRQAAHT
jgi:hypothetical protein